MVNLIKGGIAIDNRGHIRYVNDFDMSQVKRFYLIQNKDEDIIRGWRAHKIEQRWFYAVSGKFEIDIVKIDDWDDPSPDLAIQRLVLDSEEKSVLHLPVGYGTAVRSMEEKSELLVFADFLVDNSPLDNFTWPADYFVNKGK